MNVRNLTALALPLFFILSSTVALAETAKARKQSLQQQSENRLTSFEASLNTKDILAAKSSAVRECGWNTYQTNKSSWTYEKRLVEQKKVASCLNEKKALASAMAVQSGDYGFASAFDLAIRPLEEEVSEEGELVKATNSFFGLSWGLGFGFSFSQDNAINEASIVNGVVRASSNKKQQPRLVLEFHRFVPWICNTDKTDMDFGCGPFVAVAAKQDDILGGVGVGWMWGFKSNPKDEVGFSVGVGAILDSDVKDLASGFKDGEPAPAGETTVRFETESRWSGLLFVTRTF